MTRGDVRRLLVAVIPAAVPLSMATVFAGLRRYVTAAPTAYNIGFAVYWLGWCLVVPLWLLGPRTAARLLTSGRRLSSVHIVLLAAPVVGAVVTQLIPLRKAVDGPTAAVMAGTAIINAVGEELLWRAVFMREGHGRPSMMAWSLIGFSGWHFAPQIVLPSRLGRGRFVAGSALVGIASTLAASKAGGLRQVVVAHAMTDMCGVTAARFRLDRHGQPDFANRL